MSTHHLTSDLWTLLESPPVGCEAVADLWHWSLNFDTGRGPAALFLDLIGYYTDEFGCDLYPHEKAGYPLLGFVELAKLGAALTAYADDPHGVRSFVGDLLEAETR
jgi:hypothetical protein